MVTANSREPGGGGGRASRARNKTNREDGNGDAWQAVQRRAVAEEEQHLKATRQREKTAMAKLGKQFRDGRWLKRSNSCKQHVKRRGQLW